MMIVDTLISIAEWLNDGVCKEFKFKLPPKEVGAAVDSKYEYELVNPYAFPAFIPTRDKLPPGIISNMPSVVVQIVEGQDDILKNTRDIKINLGISCWNPGLHSKDIFYPEDTKPEQPEKYRSTYDGWMDAWNFVDAIIRELESRDVIGGVRISGNISFGSYKEQEAIADIYPMWMAWVQFTTRSDFIRNHTGYEEFL